MVGGVAGCLGDTPDEHMRAIQGEDLHSSISGHQVVARRESRWSPRSAARSDDQNPPRGMALSVFTVNDV